MTDQKPVPASERRVEIGGLMRCCLGTVAESDALTDLGEVWDCKYEAEGNARLIVDEISGRWRWNK